MRLIDADALKARAIKCETFKLTDAPVFFKAVGTKEIDKAPTIDAEPVVRCENCQFWDNEHISSEGLAKCVTGESGIRYRRSYDFCSRGAHTVVRMLVHNAPAVDAEPIRHGHWIVKETAAGALYTVCSHCNASVKYNDEYGTVVMNLKGANYCPNCGAKMDEVSK